MIRTDFPFFKENKYIYLDNASTSQKPKCVLDKINEYNEQYNSNSGRGSYELSHKSTLIMDNCRNKIKEYFNIKEGYDVVFTKNATESINLVAYSSINNFKEDDEIILFASNHHANIVPWQFIKKIKNVKLVYSKLNEKGEIDLKDLKKRITKNTKLIALSHVVNTTGVENDVYKISEIANGIDLLVDISQSVIHKKLDLQKINATYYVFSAHKMFGPQGLGILIGKSKNLNELPPFIYGGDMIEYVDYNSSTFKESPYKFEGGTQNISSIYGFYYAIEYFDKHFDYITEQEKNLHRYALKELEKLNFVNIYNKQENIPIIAFNVNNVHSHDVSSILDYYKISIRTGQHCTALLMKELNISSCCRISIGAYNTKEEINSLILALKKVNEIFS